MYETDALNSREQLRVRCSALLKRDNQLAKYVNHLMDASLQKIISRAGRSIGMTDSALLSSDRMIHEAERKRDKNQAECEASLLAYTKELCRSICDDMQNTLPLELRNMIYWYLIVKPHKPLCIERLENSLCCMLYRPRFQLDEGQQITYHCADMPWLEDRTAVEYMSELYRMFEVSFINLSIIGKFLEKGLCQYMAVPKNYVKQIRLVLTVTNTAVVKDYPEHSPLVPQDPTKSLQTARERLEQNLRPLFTIPKNVHLTFATEVGPHSPWWSANESIFYDVGRILMRVYPVVSRLHEAGYTIRVLFNGSDIKDVHNTKMSMESWMAKLFPSYVEKAGDKLESILLTTPPSQYTVV